MRVTFFIVTTIALQALLYADSHSSTEPHPMSPSNRTHATANITVQHSESKPFDETTTPTLKEIILEEVFAGDIEGESSVRALQIQNEDRSASMLSVQRFRGTLGQRHGTFVLQGSETVKNGKIEAKWSVVPGSGTGDLTGLHGDGGFSGDFGKASHGFLDYWFK